MRGVVCVDCMWQSVAWCLPGIPSEHLLRNVFLTLLSRNPVFPTQEKTGGVTHVYEISDHTHPLNSKNPSVCVCVLVCVCSVCECVCVCSVWGTKDTWESLTSHPKRRTFFDDLEAVFVAAQHLCSCTACFWQEQHINFLTMHITNSYIHRDINDS